MYLKSLASYLLFFVAILSWDAMAFNNELSIRGGMNLNYAKVEARQGTQDKFVGYGFNTHFGYKWIKWEFLATSYVYFGKVGGLEFDADGVLIQGSGGYRNTVISPVFKYLTDWEVKKNWFFYVGLGPTWSLQTIKLRNFESDEDFNREHKLVYDSRGGSLTLGVEEQLPFKDMHPVYIEMVYTYLKSHKLSVVDTSDFRETNILSTQGSKQDISTSTILLSIGITLF